MKFDLLDPDLMTLAETAALLRCSERTLARCRATKYHGADGTPIPYPEVRKGKQVYVSRRGLTAWVRALNAQDTGEPWAAPKVAGRGQPPGELCADQDGE